MTLGSNIFDYRSKFDNSILDATGNKLKTNLFKISYPFENYEIDIIVDSERRFVGISGIKVKQDFLTPKQKIAIHGFLNVDNEYRE